MIDIGCIEHPTQSRSGDTLAIHGKLWGALKHFTEFPKVETFTLGGIPETIYSGRCELVGKGAFSIFLSEFQVPLHTDFDWLDTQIATAFALLESQSQGRGIVHGSRTRGIGDSKIMGRLVFGSFNGNVIYLVGYQPDNKTICKISSAIPWNEGTAQLLNTIHIDISN